MTVLQRVLMTIKTEIWWTVTVIVMVMMVMNVSGLSGPNVCMVKQKYNITKRVKYRAPMSVRTYEWCFAMPPRCSKWNTEMRDLTRLETEERTAEMAVCCPGYKLKDVSCVPMCPSGKTGQGCSEDCPSNKWGPSCAHECQKCDHGSCDAVTGECRCQDGWQGESCEISMTTTATAAMMEQLLTTESASTKTTAQTTPTFTTRSSTDTTITATSSSATIPTTSRTTITKIQSTPRTASSMSTEDIQTIITSTPITSTSLLDTKKELELTTTFKTPKVNVMFSNVSLSTVPMSTLNTYTVVAEDRRTIGPSDKKIVAEDVTKETKNVVNSSYNRTEIPSETTKIIPSISKTKTTAHLNTYKNDVEMTLIPTMNIPSSKETTVTTKSSTALTAITIKQETRKTSTTVRQPFTTKLKPKEIWIKPAQKGESPIVEVKVKPNQELLHSKFKHKEVFEVTTPKTIIVSIIPTSVTYLTFKKFALTTTSSMAQKNSDPTKNLNNRTTDHQGPFTKPMIVPTTSTPFTVRNHSGKANTSPTINPSLLHQYVTKTNSYTSTTRRTFNTALPTNQTTNSMTSTANVANKRLNSSLLTTAPSFSTNVTKSTRKQHSLSEITTSKTIAPAPPKHKMFLVTEKATTQSFLAQKQYVTTTQRKLTSRITEPLGVTKTFNKMHTYINSKINFTHSNTTANTVTDDPSKDEETFHILTEPEHITAVMGDKGSERSTIDLISVISIAGGVMLALITVAVVIVMLERCKKPRYEDVRKYNDIKMQVMIDNNDVPPPYVRSIFHTPLPDPPTSEKCHYQPISTLDRNLKQFMRPVVVQTISPLMLENFRGILECHYDHLPRRSQDMGTMPTTRCSMAPSINEREELLPPPPRVHSLTDSDIEAMKCEAQLDVIDNTTSEPLYAEIPCWRPASAHAIEVVNLNNGEAVTEL